MGKITCIIVNNEEESRDLQETLIDKFEEIKILAVEDDPDLAIEKIIRLKPDIVFINIEIPAKNGFNVIKEVRANHVFPAFVIVTNYIQYSIKAIKNTVFDYLIKPIDVDELKKTINRYQYRTGIFPIFESYKLSEREKEIVRYMYQGKTSREMAVLLYISKNTVDTHRRNILEKTGMKSTTQLIIKFSSPSLL